MLIDPGYWKGKKVLITGHTGFKGSWLSLWLHRLGAKVSGFSLEPNTDPSHFGLTKLDELVDSHIGDIRNLTDLQRAVDSVRPKIVFHLAAQPLVRESYTDPITTLHTNVMGTANVLECARECGTTQAVLVVTSDKCYENNEWHWGYRENEPLGGYDPYSASKACTELVAAAWRQSFTGEGPYATASLKIATARAGNVIGGGDWSADRLIPDLLRSLTQEHPLTIRHPQAIRPWQHVLEPLGGYLLLAQQLAAGHEGFAEAWNFGPYDSDAKSVSWIVEQLSQALQVEPNWQLESSVQPHEAHYLKLDCSKAHGELGWRPVWNLSQCLEEIAHWHQQHSRGEDVRSVSLATIERYEEALLEI